MGTEAGTSTAAAEAARGIWWYRSSREEGSSWLRSCRWWFRGCYCCGSPQLRGCIAVLLGLQGIQRVYPKAY